MDFELFTPEHDVFRQSLREYITKEITPHVDDWEEAGGFPDDVFRQLGELGYLGMRYPEKYGGGDDILAEAIFHEEITYCGSAGVGADIGAHIGIAMPHILTFGTDEQKEKYLVPGIKGEKTAALGITEPDAGSDVIGIKTTAVRDGDEWVINGSKTYITNGVRADFLVLAAQTDKEKKHQGLSMFIVDTDTPGYEIVNKLDKLGWRSSGTAELAFTDMRIPADALLGQEGNGFFQIVQGFVWERLIMALGAVSGAELVMNGAAEYAKQRMAFGQPIGKFQVIAHYFADMATQIEAARSLTYRVLRAYVEGQNPIKEVAMARLVSGQVACDVFDTCLQVFGGYGYMEESNIPRGYRDIRLMRIGGGTDEIMKEIISKFMGLG